MRVYISGPITKGEKITAPSAIEAARKTFASAEAILQARGHEPINPFKVIPYRKELTWKDYMKANLKALVDCDGIYMLPGWHESEGALLENFIARKLKMKIVKC